MKYPLYLIFISIISASCAAPMQYRSYIPCGGESDLPFSPFGGERDISIVGRAKIVMPKYRVRGVCRIRSGPSGGLVIDFEHSSLFGAYREDATIILEDGELTIIDRERGRLYDNDASLSLLGSELAFDIFPDDMRYAMLLAAPECDAIEGLEVDAGDGRWRLTGVWRGRDMEIEGRGGYGPERFTLCAKDKTNCYIISYKQTGNGGYPRSLQLARDGGSERITLEIVDIRFTGPGGIDSGAKRIGNMELYGAAGVSSK